MRPVFLITIAFVIGGFSTSCQSDQNGETSNPNLHEVKVAEVLQTNEYTYLRVTENGTELWLATPKLQASAGETYYYEGGLQMTDFTSKELNRTFKAVLFLDNLSKSPGMVKKEIPSIFPQCSMSASNSATNSNTVKQEIKIDHVPGEITISELFSKKDSYAGKTVKIKGQVTKFNPAIMNKNWIHLQDGTEADGKFDLTVTSDIEVSVEDVVTLEGVIALNKDFGFGYFYEVLMEDARLIK